MKAQLPHPTHASYSRHRKERALQIYLPIGISALLLIGLIAALSMATFQSGGDSTRWAAISVIWLLIPVCLGGLIVMTLLFGMVYGMSRLLGSLPRYTGLAQDYICLARARILQGAQAASDFIIQIEGQLARLKTFFKRNTQ